MTGYRGRQVARAAEAERLRAAALAAPVPAERFAQAYRAARCAAAALLAPGRPRRGPTDVWARLAAEQPELAEWASAFGGYSRLAADLEIGLPRAVPPRMAADFVFALDRFLDLVDRRLGILEVAA